jgi:GNAT superfamily N-acetyltransferase
MITFEAYDHADLASLIRSDRYRQSPQVPITQHRALSQLQNPRLEAGDILLICAWEGQDLRGYLGVLPDRAYGPASDQPHKVGWLSSLWVSPHARGQGLGVALIEQAWSHWGPTLLAGDYVPFTKKLYDRSGHFLAQPYLRDGLRLYLRADLATLLPPKHPYFARAKGLLRGIDAAMNVVIAWQQRLKGWGQQVPTYQRAERVDEEAQAFIEARQGQELFRRGAKELNWMMTYPWVLTQRPASAPAGHYHFSSVADSFQYHFIKLRDANGQLTACLLLLERDQTLQIPYLYQDDCLEAVGQFLGHWMVSRRVKTFTTYHPALGPWLKQAASPAWLKRRFQCAYVVARGLSALVVERGGDMQDGDGDLGFT